MIQSGEVKRLGRKCQGVGRQAAVNPFFNNGRRLAPLPCSQCRPGFRKQELIQGKGHPGRDISTLSVSKTMPGRIASSECALALFVPSLNTIFFFSLRFEFFRVQEVEQNITRRV
jgi:hypothetical protein